MLKAVLVPMALAIAIATPAMAMSLSSLLGASEPENFKMIHVADLAKLMAQHDPKLVVLDANHVDFREANGVIPGARMLSSSGKYDVASELPADKNAELVFYCVNTY